jgi:hypothetical protein
VATAARWTGRLLVVASLALWLGWLGWRIASGPVGVVGGVVLLAELAAIVVAAVVSMALWHGPARAVTSRERAVARDPRTPLASTFSVVLGVDTPTIEAPTIHAPTAVAPSTHNDDTGEVACARHALRSLRGRPGLATTAWSLVALEGMRRLVSIGLVVAVLLSGRFPFDVPPVVMLAALAASQLLLTIGHSLLSGGVVRPGARLRWSMASVGAGFGDGISRTGLPIRWTATLATMVSLNLAVSLRGVSDRWTHGLGAMAHEQRVISMLVAAWMVGWGLAALRTLPQPQLGYYGATRRLEETSTRRLALGATFTVAAVGMVAGMLPAGLPT